METLYFPRVLDLCYKEQASALLQASAMPRASICLGRKSRTSKNSWERQVLQQELLSLCYDEQASVLLRAFVVPRASTERKVLQQQPLFLCCDKQASAILRASALPQASTCLGGIVTPWRPPAPASPC